MMKTKKKAIICIYKDAIIDADKAILETLASKGFEVHLFDNVNEEDLNCDILPYIVNNIYGIESNEYDIYLSSNIKEFIMLEYALYRNWILGALYINNNPLHIKLDELYGAILDKEISEYEEKSNFYLIKEEDNVFVDYNVFDGDFNSSVNNINFENKVYIHMSTNHVFSIKNMKCDENIINTNLINLDNSDNVGKYKYHFDIEYLEDYIKSLEYYSNSISGFIKYNGEFISEFEEHKMKISKIPDFEKSVIQFRLDNELLNKKSSDQFKILLSSVLFNIFDESRYLEYLLNILIESNSINKYNRFFAYSQCERYKFISNNISDEKISFMIEKLYDKIYKEFLNDLSEQYSPIPKGERNSNTVFVVTSQYLSMNHAPTKIALDVCYNLTKNLNKKVILINTKEVCTLKGIIQMGRIAVANALDYLDNIDVIKYKNIKIPFYQAKEQMPSENEIINILNMLEKHKPSMIINIGTTLVGDLCTKIIPTVTIPLEVNGYSKSTFYVINNEEDYKNYSSKHIRNKKSFIITKTAFELKPQKNILSKEELEIPQNKFIIAVVGNRLNHEIDEKFLEVLEESCKLNNSYVLFIDNFKFSESQNVKYKNLMINCKSMGYQEDLLAVLENIDIYVNPQRKGGGTSAIYAMYLGKPVVTLNYGDVAAIAGMEFCVNDYKIMLDKISKYYTDKEFYDKKSNIAQKRALELTDMSKYIKDVYEKTKNNILY